MPLGTARKGTENTIRWVQVDGPAPKGDRIQMGSLFHNIFLGHHVVALKTAAFPFSGNRPHPFQR